MKTNDEILTVVNAENNHTKKAKSVISLINFPSYKFYKTNMNDPIPNDVLKYLSETWSFRPIVMTVEGMQEIANHYHEKYKIDIYVSSGYLGNLANDIHDMIKNQQNKNCRFGMVFLFPESGHAFPLIYEKNDSVENIFFLDTGQHLGEISTNTNSQSCKGAQFRKKLITLLPNLNIWSHLGKRQNDLSSCTIDAMVILKDGLRLIPSLTAVAQNKFIKKEDDVNLFHMPEELLKTAQIGYFITQSNANLTKVIHTHEVKNEQGEKTGETVKITLAEFRKKHDVVVNHDTDNLFGCFTLFKSKKYEKIIQQRWAEMQQNDDNVMSSYETIKNSLATNNTTPHTFQVENTITTSSVIVENKNIMIIPPNENLQQSKVKNVKSPLIAMSKKKAESSIKFCKLM